MCRGSIKIRAIAFALLISAFVSVGEAQEGCSSYGPWFEEQAGCDPCSVSGGTLFRWSQDLSASGGPDLTEPLVTDRPDFTESSSTVGRGVLQLEMGYTYSFDNDGTEQLRSHSYPETLFRYGILADWLELRLDWNYAEEEIRGANPDLLSGGEDLGLGLKVALTPQAGLLPEMALIPQMSVPTGSSAFSDEEVLPGVIWIYSWEVSDRISTAGSSQINRAIDGLSGEAYLEFAQSWAASLSFSEKLGGYCEWYGLIPSSAESVLPEHYFNGGLTYLINNDLQLDIRAGTGLNDAALDYFVGTGISIRMP
ncbi:Transporter [Planctomycetales bacterium 10988]|nr:Transporter [Planctomycetales bacterium 10988]